MYANKNNADNCLKLKVFNLVSGVLIIGFGLLLFSCRVKSIDFNSAKWKTGSQITRGSMTEDLKSKKIIYDKTRAEIIEILGKPDSEMNSRNPNAVYKHAVFYNVVVNPRCYFWNCWIEISFDNETQRVVDIQVSD